MNKTLSSVATGVAVIALILGVVSLNKTPSVVRGNDGQSITGPKGDKGDKGDSVVGPRGLTGAPGRDAQVRLGAVPGPDFIGDYQTINGVLFVTKKVGLTQATTSVCTIQSPNATTTLRAAAISFITSTTSQAHVQLAYAATSNATTSVIAQNTIPASTAYELIATGTIPLTILAPNQWVVGKMAMKVGGTETTGTYSPTGSCTAIFQGI